MNNPLEYQEWLNANKDTLDKEFQSYFIKDDTIELNNIDNSKEQYNKQTLIDQLEESITLLKESKAKQAYLQVGNLSDIAVIAIEDKTKEDINIELNNLYKESYNNYIKDFYMAFANERTI